METRRLSTSSLLFQSWQNVANLLKEVGRHFVDVGDHVRGHDGDHARSPKFESYDFQKRMVSEHNGRLVQMKQ